MPSNSENIRPIQQTALAFLALIATTSTGCSTAAAQGPTRISGAAEKRIPNYILSAVSDPGRPTADTIRDAHRKPAASLAFAGVEPGDKVADLVPWQGYFTRIFSKIVGPSGHVYAYNPSDIDAEYKAEKFVLPNGLDPQYPNVTYMHAPMAEFSTPEKLDLVWTSQNYHDMHDKFFGPVDMSKFNKAVFNSLKPGGTYIVLDHAAQSGSGLRDTETLHRIDPAAVEREVLAAGFILVGTSDILRNPEDDHAKSIFDPAEHDKTDQFILKFRKPLSAE